jgi:integrase
LTTHYNKNRNKWMYDFVRSGKRYSSYCLDEAGKDVTTKRAADACEARVKRAVEISTKAGAKGGVIVTGAYTVEQMFADYVSQHAGRQRSWQDNMKKHVRDLLAFFGRQTAAASLTVDDVERFITHSRNEKLCVYIGGPQKCIDATIVRDNARHRSDSTTNRYLTTLRAAINWGAKHGKLARLHVRRLAEPKELPNPVAPDQVRAILTHAQPHLRLAITLAVHTGMRLDETLGLLWEQVDLDARTIILRSAGTKAKIGQVVFINDDLAAVLHATPRVCAEVVTYQRIVTKRDRSEERMPPRPIKSLRRSWEAAQKAAKVFPPHRFHDLRATFCTAVLVANNNPVTLRSAARHASLTTTMRYAQVQDATVRGAFNATAGLTNSQTEVTNEVADAPQCPGEDA